MSAAPLDPWLDAAAIAAGLTRADSRFVVVLGAEAWCQTCRTLRPGFDALALQHNDERNVWLWLDLEEHAEFLGDFIPEDLPLLLSYSGNALTHAFVPDIHAMAALAGMPTAPRVDYADVPDMRARFLTQDWAA